MSNIFIGLKKTCLGVLETEKRDKYNETDLKEDVGIKIFNYSAPFAMLAPSLCTYSTFEILTKTNNLF